VLDSSRGTEPGRSSCGPNSILIFGVFECSAGITAPPDSLVPGSKTAEVNRRDRHVGSPHILSGSEGSLNAVIEQSEIGESTGIKPLRPLSEIVRNGNDGTAGDLRVLTSAFEEIHIGAHPVSVQNHVVVRKQ
jgi:hypothetical protein